MCFVLISGRSNKTERQIQDLTDNASVHNHITSPQRSSKRVSSISINMPAAGLGSRPPSIISTSNSNDEGGFNEPSPEIKAKLRPAYDFESPKFQARLPQHSPTKSHENDEENETDKEAEKPSLNYVDVGYRLNPDGSEAREVFGESELYETTAKVTDMHKKFHANSFAQETTTVYAIIKPDLLPNNTTDLYYAAKAAAEKLTSPTKTNSGPNSLVSSPVKTASSPPVGVVSPIRRRSSETSIKSTPPMSPPSAASINNSSSNSRSMSSIAKGVAPMASLDANEDLGSLDIPALPQRPPPTAVHINNVDSLDMQDLEYADTSAGEDEDDLMRTIEGDVDLVDDLYIDDKIIRVTEIMPAPTEAIAREDSLPDAMTADEAERLLSSR